MERQYDTAGAPERKDMKLPEKIKGRNRIRNGAIVLYFKRDGMDYPQLSEKFGLSERHIVRILSQNHAFVKVDKEWEKSKRINRLKRWIKKAPNPTESKLALQQELRKEIEGESKKPSNTDTKIVIVYPPTSKPSSEDNPNRLTVVDKA